MLDLSCRLKDGKYWVVTDRWQHFSQLLLSEVGVWHFPQLQKDERWQEMDPFPRMPRILEEGACFSSLSWTHLVVVVRLQAGLRHEEVGFLWDYI